MTKYTTPLVADVLWDGDPSLAAPDELSCIWQGAASAQWGDIVGT